MSSPSAPHTSYQYSLLDPSLREIRLLHLLPTQLSESYQENTPTCTISQAPLVSTPKYIALSYVWGTQPSQRTIKINEHSFPVGENLYVALQHLQGPEELILWIDAICINQTDDNEKSTQVQLMRDIYRHAVGVVVWLGSSTPQTDTAMYWLDKLGESLLAMGIEKLKAEHVGKWDTWDETVDEEEDSRPWFSRAWCLQECSNGKEVIFQCG
ncbi:HET-domain-containing protein, partial [Lindgomyces ingoldianus]